MTHRAVTSVERDFHERMHAAQMYGLWELASQMTKHPEPAAIPYLWPAALIDAMVEESGTVVPAHRHTPTAIRFIMEGDGAYTAVDGERVYMAPGDLVLTPSWAWHDHGNETDKPVVWMDGLDVPLIQALNAMFFQMYDKEQFPLSKPHNASLALHGHVSLSPTWVKERPQSSPLLLYSWETTLRSLNAMRDIPGDEWDDIALEYTHPQTGGALLPTMSCWV